jgi:hypothetical protein
MTPVNPLHEALRPLREWMALAQAEIDAATAPPHVSREQPD